MAITSADMESVAAHPPHVKDVKTTASLLAETLEMDEKRLNGRLTSNRSFVWIKRQVGPRKTEALKSLKLDGIGFIPEHSRFYPNGTLAAQLIGFTGIDDRGLEGIEFYYNAHLEGKDYKLKVLRDGFNRKFDIKADTALNYSGNNLILTIDKTIQFITESALADGVEECSAKSGMAVVMAPETGAVLALAHMPVFNPNFFGKFKRENWRNKAITDPFEPGSTMKIFSAAAAIEYGNCTRETAFFCENGTYQIGEDVVHDARPYGNLTLEKIIKYSSNIGIIKVSEKTGPRILYKTLRDFGFGEKTRIDCPGETSGSLSSYKRWSKIDAGAISFGHGISVSCIQLIRAVCAIANKGMLMKPHIVQAVTDPNGRPVETMGLRKIRRAISEKTAESVKKMMRTVVEKKGTGVKASLKGYTVCGKTGTSKKINKRGEYAEGKYIASFVGFAPAETPKIAILVVIDEPEEDYYGGVVAAPVFRKMAFEILNYMNIPPDRKLT